jgi:hypothetical protein
VTLVAGASVVASILDAEKLEALVVLLPSTGYGSKLIATTAVERRCRTALFPGTPTAAPAATFAAALCGAARTAARGAFSAASG